MTAPVSRRTLVRGAALGAAGTVVGGSTVAAALAAAGGPQPTAPGLLNALGSPLIFTSPKVEPFVDELPRLPIRTGGTYDIAARTTRHRFHSSFDESPAFGYGGETYLGPVVENVRDVPTRFTIRNELGAHPFAKDIDTSLHGVGHDQGTKPRTVLHMHGGETPPEHDGHPEDFLAQGEHFTHRFPNQQEAAALWYHDHSMGTTRLNVYAGLASMYLVRDRFDTGRPGNPLGLPAGEFEVPFMMQEKIFTAGGVQSVRSTPLVPEGSWEGGAVGDVGVVNGKVWPEMSVARGLYRFRMINAGSYSVWDLHFANQMPFHVIGTDGGLLDAPVRTTRFRLAPAERIDVLVDFNGLRPGETVELRNSEPVPGQAAVIGEVTMPFFCRFRATTSRGFTGPVPTTLRGGRNQPARLPVIPRPTRQRTVTITQPSELRIPPAVMSLNNLGFTSDQIEKPVQGRTEVWNLVNVTPDPHPIHVHLVMFRIIDRQKYRQLGYQLRHPKPAYGTRWAPPVDAFRYGPAVPADPWESGRKDTVRVDGDTVTRIVIQWPTADELGFDPDQPFMPHGVQAQLGGGHGGHGTRVEPIQGYVWHCHILDHEDHDMMLKLRTVAT